jgi:hypothetical protein
MNTNYWKRCNHSDGHISHAQNVKCLLNKIKYFNFTLSNMSAVRYINLLLFSL